jgi:hypothetical protein
MIIGILSLVALIIALSVILALLVYSMINLDDAITNYIRNKGNKK